MPQDIPKEETLKKSKMMSEGGPVLAAYFNRDIVYDMQIDKEKMAAKAMIDEGGIGAEMYYFHDEKIANLDVENDDSTIH